MTPETNSPLYPPVARAAYADRTAWMMAGCSALAYVRAEDGATLAQQLSNALNELRLNLIARFNQAGTHGYLARNDRFAVLAFRGTEKDWRNILTDLKIRFYRDRVTGAKIARGFSDAYALVATDVDRAVAQLEPKLPLYITGHSLGGALAAVAAMRIHPEDRVAACYTFGCPRVGDGEFVLQLWKVPVYRLVHAADIVARVPFAFGYCHAGDFRYIKRSGKLVQSPGAVRRTLGFTFTVVMRFKRIFEDHRIAEYRDNLEKWARMRQELAEAAPPPTKTQAASAG
jgi:pimeloyl-ACP methyl ester carboxylesterase